MSMEDCSIVSAVWNAHHHFYYQGVALGCEKMPFQGEAELVRLFF